MADDIAPELLDKINKAFENTLSGDKTASNLLNRINSGKGTYKIAGQYADHVGSALSKAFRSNLTANNLPDGKMYWNICEKVVDPMLKEDYELVADAAQTVQTSLNKSANIGIKAQRAKLNNDRIEGFNKALFNAQSAGELQKLLGDPVVTYSRSVVDDTLKDNVDFQGKSGLTPRIIRTAEANCCEWCSNIEGTYDYPNVPKDVYRRHENCRCDVEYDPGTGKLQNVHTKEWRDADERDRIEERKDFARSNMGINKEQLKAVNDNHSGFLKMDLQFFGSSPEKDLYKQSSASLMRGIKSSEKQISIHEDKIKNPEKYFPEWNQWDSRSQQGYIKHWQKEINNFQESNERRRNELRKRGEYNE